MLENENYLQKMFTINVIMKTKNKRELKFNSMYFVQDICLEVLCDTRKIGSCSVCQKRVQRKTLFSSGHTKTNL